MPISLVRWACIYIILLSDHLVETDDIDFKDKWSIFILLVNKMGIDFIYLSYIYILVTILAHLSWKLKWAFPIACRPSSVRPSVRTFFLFRHLHNHWANLNQTWHKASLGGGDSSLLIWKATPFSNMG